MMAARYRATPVAIIYALATQNNRYAPVPTAAALNAHGRG